MSTPESIGQRVAQLREKSGLSRDAVTRKLWQHGFETTQTALRALESGTNERVDIFLLEAVAKAFGVTLAELLGEVSAADVAGDPTVDRFAKVLAVMGPAEVEPHLRALELLAQERKATEKSRGRRRAAG